MRYEKWTIALAALGMVSLAAVAATVLLVARLRRPA